MYKRAFLFSLITAGLVTSCSPAEPGYQEPPEGLELTAASAPLISSISGISSDDAGISNGAASMSCGSTWNRWRILNDQPGLYTWTLNGSGFGTSPGTVTLQGIPAPITSWSNTKIQINPTLSLVLFGVPEYAARDMDIRVEVRTVTGDAVSRIEQVVPSLRSRIYQQCTWHVAKRRLEMGLKPSPTAYLTGYTTIDKSWQPHAGDQLRWDLTSGRHAAIIESVSGPSTVGTKTVYGIRISQYNRGCDNMYSVYDTTFEVIAGVVTRKPQFSSTSTGAAAYYAWDK